VSVVKGVFLLAIIQGLIMGVFYWLANIPFAWFWTLLSMIFAILPVVGISFLVLPTVVILLLMGETTSALLLLFGFYAVVNPLNRVLQPRPDRKEAYFHFALVIIAVFGGVQLFGLLGIIYGPVIMILMITSVDIYLEYFSRSAGEQALSLAGEQQTVQGVMGESVEEYPDLGEGQNR